MSNSADDTSRSQVQTAAAAANGRGDTAELFPPGHRLSRLVRASYSSICQALAGYDLNLLFNQSADASDPRSAFRKDYGALLGPGMNLIMPTAAAYMCSPGENRVFLPSGTDKTLAAYLQRVGFMGEVLYHDGLDQMCQDLRAAGRKVYSIDDLGQGTDDCTANTHANMVAVNSKEMVAKLSSYAATERHRDMFEVQDSDFTELCPPGRLLYLKTCNTENAGEGVYPVASLEDFNRTLDEVRQKTRRYDLNRTLVLQPQIVGKNKSFQIFLDPADPGRVQVVALTDQLIGDDGKKYAGSVNHVVTAENLEVVGDAVLDLVDRTLEQCPGSFGFIMCDYFEQDNGGIVIFDPGLRPSSNTGAAMVKLWVEEVSGQEAAVANSPWFDFKEPGIRYEEIARRLGDLGEPAVIARTQFGVLPRGHNPIQGKTRFIIITPTQQDYADFRAELEGRIIFR